MTTNEPAGRPRMSKTRTWLLIGLILFLAVMVPLGLYYISTIPFTNGTTGSNLSVPDTGVVPITPPPANPAPQAAPNGKTMTLTLVDQMTKRPIPGLTVRCNARPFVGRSDVQGKVRVPIPETTIQYFYIRANGRNYVPKRLVWSTFDPSLGGGDIPSTYTMVMEKGTKISGKILNDARQPVYGANVLLDFEKKFANPHEQTDPNVNNRNRPIKTDDDGNWSFAGAPLNCDEIRLGAWDYKYVIDDSTPLQPYPDVAKLYDGTATFVLRRGVTLNAMVTGPGGTPMEGASIGIGGRNMGFNGVPAQTTDSTGKVTYHFDPGQQVILTIQARGCAPEIKQLTMSADEQTVPIALSNAHRIFGRVVDSNGRPVSGAIFNLQYWRGMQSIQANFQSDGTGHFHWNEAPADAVTFNVGSQTLRGITIDLMPDKENVVKLGAVVRIRGSVTDAETGRPIEDFHLTPGIVFNDGQQVNWQPRWNFDIGKKHGGFFDFPDTWSYPGFAVRIEAKGHLPVVSDIIKPEDGDAQLDIKMLPAKDITATVHAPDGSLVSGAIGVMALPQQMAYIQNSRQVMNQGTPPQASGADGVLDFPPQVGNFRIAVMADAGYAEVDQDDLAKSTDVTLSPWGRIEGKVMIGSAPASGKNVDMYPQTLRPFYDRDEIRVQDQISALTDSDGKFVIDRVPPGTWGIGRRVQVSNNSNANASTQTIEVAAGKTVAVTIGGTGRPIVGKIVLPSALTARADWTYGSAQVMTKNTAAVSAPPMPLVIRMLSQERRQQWMRDWLKTDEGKAFLAKQGMAMAGLRTYPIVISPDGSFRADDVPAGDYQLSISIQQFDPRMGYGQQIGIASAEFTIPEMPGGRSDDPLQLDPVNIIALGKYNIGDPVYDLPLRTPDGKVLKFSDFRGKYLLLNFFPLMDASIESFKQVYAGYAPDEQLSLLTISTSMIMPGQTPQKMSDIPWHQASLVMEGQSTWSILNTNFDARNSPGAWLIGPDGKVVAENLKGDAIRAVVTAAIGPPTVAAVQTTQPTTAP